MKKLRRVRTKSGRDLLKNVSGVAVPGEVVALMGASGAGKTTLLNTLLQRNLKARTKKILALIRCRIVEIIY